ncbi:hypothetical protein KFL_000020450 [Klebsormidium nitens]|uniref:DUF6816 domain-containing protein n=1 Tax=Klebsormidium nitens TaxID=105231 RepID=A0A1Y1HII9_KLENI|nr:hypothetical protein KFL_000020450 [Klebsormidium nitens]|eukprot:GAQ77683.1 hypothetical protein KFL_000020450 [Klebsormidium nitens]
MLFTGAECQVAATMAAAAEVQPKTAPTDVSLFRAFGISAPDIYYPKFFEGYWEVDSVLVDVDIPGGIEQLSLPRLASIRDMLDRHEKWEVRYINHKGNIIADRVYNTLSLIEGSVMQFRGIWNPDEANRMRLEVTVDSAGRKTDHGFGVETLITRRSFDSPAPGTFDSSEFSRETTDNPRIYQGPPHVDAKQISSRYKWDPIQEFPDEMKVIQKIATFDLPGEQDSLGKDVENLFRVLSSTTRPSVIKKYVSRMTRKTEPAAS